MEADLARYYQVDLGDRWRPGRRLTLRRLVVLVRHLPDDSATAFAINEGPPWRTEHELADLSRMDFLRVHGVEKPIPHPLSPFAKRDTGPSETHKQALAAAKARRDERARLIAEGAIR